MNTAAQLFQPIHIGGVEVRNRIGMAPMAVFGLVSADGCFTRRAIDYYVERARGGVGLIVTGYSEIENEVEVSLPGVVQNPSVHQPRFVAAAAELTERVHAHGARILLQLTLGLGRVGYEPWISGTPIAPSPVPAFWDPDVACRAVGVEEIAALVRSAGEAARTARLAGFDGVEIHALHEGYLLDQFAMTMFNRRDDEYGGDLDGRLRFSLEVLREIKGVAGQDFPVVMRFSVKSFIKDWGKGALPGEDFAEMGRDVEESLAVARILERAGYDALDADCGSYEGYYWAHPPGYQEHGCYLPYVAPLTQAVDIPVLVAGRMDKPDVAERALAEGAADMVMLGRGLLADPQWPHKVRAGRAERIRPCVGCHDGCLGRQDICRPMSCAVNPACGREAEYALRPALRRRRVLVVGGGMAGMEAARVAAARGHTVKLLEQAEALGGHVIAGSVPPFKSDERRLLEWYERELAEAGVEVVLGRRATPDSEADLEPEVVILAPGSTAKVPPIPGVDGDHVLSATEALLDPERVGDPVVVIGGGLVGCEVAVWLAQQGRRVSLVEALGSLMAAVEVPHPNKLMMRDMLPAHGVEVHTGVTIAAIRDDGLELDGADGPGRLAAASVVLATGYEPRAATPAAWQDVTPEVYVIGDAAGPRNIMAAIWEGYEVARGV